jgi:hypothetical protein
MFDSSAFDTNAFSEDAFDLGAAANSYDFTAQTGVNLSTEITSNTLYADIAEDGSTVTVTGGTISVSGGAFSAGPTLVFDGMSLEVRVTSSASGLTTTTATLAFSSGAVGSFSVTTIAQPAVDSDADSAGWYAVMERQRRRKQRQKREHEEAELALKNAIDREIAQLLHKQEQEEDHKKELERIKALVNEYADTAAVATKSDRVLKAINEAKMKQTLASMERLQKEWFRMMEEEEFAVFMALVL